MRKLVNTIHRAETLAGAVVHIVGDVLTHRHAQ